MAFAPGYDFDVFISYAHVDNTAMHFRTSNKICWVTEFMSELKARVIQGLGRADDLKFWMDQTNLGGNEYVTSTLKGAARNAATLVVILSRGYVDSMWCQEEIKQFVGSAKADGSLFVVAINDIPIESRPKELQDLTGYKFYDNEIGDALSPTTEDYYKEMLKLRNQLVDKLQALKRNDPKCQSKGTPNIKVAAAPAVLLAEGTTDLDDDRDLLATYLEELGYRVLPVNPYPRSVEQYKEMMDKDLNEAILFVQLLGPYGTRRTGDLPEGYEGLQLSRAKEGNVPVLRAYQRGIVNIEAIRNSSHRRFLEAADVMALDLEEFKSLINKKLKDITLWNEKSDRIQGNDKPIIIYVHEKDLHAAYAIRDRFISRNLPWEIMLHSENLVELAKQMNPAGLVLVYGEKAEGKWVKDQVKTFRNVSVSRKPNPPICALYFDPPENRNLMLIALPDFFRSLDSSSGESEFQNFIGEVLALRAKIPTP